MGIVRYCVWLAIALAPAMVSAATQSTLASLIPQYPRADLVQSNEFKEVATHEIVLGSLKRSGGLVEPEASRFVVGRRAASTWYIPNETRTDVVERFFKDQLGPLGKLLYECKGYGCGSSNYWANNVFGEEVLYGPEEDQHYFVELIVQQDVTYYVEVYIALRGTRKLYAHEDIIIVEPDRSGPSADSIVEALKSERKYTIAVGDQDKLVADLVEALRLEPTFRVAVVRHAKRHEGESVPQAIARSEQDAKAFAAKLVQAGIDTSRVQAYGVGPLEPMNGDVVDRIELVLISND